MSAVTSGGSGVREWGSGGSGVRSTVTSGGSGVRGSGGPGGQAGIYHFTKQSGKCRPDPGKAEAIRLPRILPCNPKKSRNRTTTAPRSMKKTKAIMTKRLPITSEVIRLDPEELFAKGYLARAEAYDIKGELDKAIADYTEAILVQQKQGLDGLEFGSLYNAARGLRKQGRTRQGDCRLHEVSSLIPASITSTKTRTALSKKRR